MDILAASALGMESAWAWDATALGWVALLDPRLAEQAEYGPVAGRAPSSPRLGPRGPARAEARRG